MTPPDPIAEEVEALAKERPRHDRDQELRDAIATGDPDEITEAAKAFVDWRIRRREVGL